MRQKRRREGVRVEESGARVLVLGTLDGFPLVLQFVDRRLQGSSFRFPAETFRLQGFKKMMVGVERLPG